MNPTKLQGTLCIQKAIACAIPPDNRKIYGAT